MHVRKRIFTFLFAALAMLLCTACGKWDYSREAVKAANQAQNTVTFKEDTKLAQSLWDALNASAQPIAIEAALKADENLKSLLTDGYSLDILTASSDDAEAAAAAIADLLTVAGRTSAGHLAMVKSPSGLYYAAALTYRTASGGSSDSNDDNNTTTDPDAPSNPDDPDDDEPTGSDPSTWEVTDGALGGKTLTIPAGVTGNLTQEQINKALTANDTTSAALQMVNLSQSSIETIDSGAFQNCTNLIQVQLSNTVKTIDQGAFLNCSSLSTINLGHVTRIHTKAFENCNSLEKIDISNVTYIGSSAFEGCSDLTEISFCTSGVTIQDSAFKSCSKLNKIDLSGVESVGSYAFYGCGALHAKLGDGLTFIGNLAFDDGTTIYYGNSVDAAKEFFKAKIEKDYISCEFDSAAAWEKIPDPANFLSRVMFKMM